MDNDNDQKIKELEKSIDDLKKENVRLNEALNVFTLAPLIVDVMIKSRGDKTPYVSAGNTIECDVVLDLEWQGRRYKIPAFEL